MPYDRHTSVSCNVSWYKQGHAFEYKQGHVFYAGIDVYSYGGHMLWS